MFSSSWFQHLYEYLINKLENNANKSTVNQNCEQTFIAVRFFLKNGTTPLLLLTTINLNMIIYLFVQIMVDFNRFFFLVKIFEITPFLPVFRIWIRIHHDIMIWNWVENVPIKHGISAYRIWKLGDIAEEGHSIYEAEIGSIVNFTFSEI